MKTIFQSATVPEQGPALASGKTTHHLKQRLLKLAMILVLGAGANAVRGSDPIGVYALVDKVVLEPNEQTPERIQIWGAFSVAEGRGETYAAPRRGYLYYKLNPAKSEVCLKEWADLKSLAGTRQCVSLASRYGEKGRVRKATEEPKDPDPYPVAMGLTRIKKPDYPPVKALFDLEPSPKSDGKTASPKNN
jgi:hypothetical protein